MSVAISVPSSTALQQGGKLFDLPLELRHEIYRYIVKGTYVDCRWEKSDPTEIVGHRFGILFASKAISDEVLGLLYSESTFRILLQFTDEKGKRFYSRRFPQRVMNIELDVRPWDVPNTYDFPSNSKIKVWKKVLRCINRPNTIRNTLRIRCRPCSSDIEDPVPEWMYEGLASLTQFRTVIVELPRDLYFQSKNYLRVGSEHIFGELEHRMEDIEMSLRDAFGPAAVKPRYGCGYRWQTRTLTFHPQEHLSKNS